MRAPVKRRLSEGKAKAIKKWNEPNTRKKIGFFFIFVSQLVTFLGGVVCIRSNGGRGGERKRKREKTVMCRIIFGELVNKFHIQRGKIKYTYALTRKPTMTGT